MFHLRRNSRRSWQRRGQAVQQLITCIFFKSLFVRAECGIYSQWAASLRKVCVMCKLRHLSALADLAIVFSKQACCYNVLPSMFHYVAICVFSAVCVKCFSVLSCFQIESVHSFSCHQHAVWCKCQWALSSLCVQKGHMTQHWNFAVATTHSGKIRHLFISLYL